MKKILIIVATFLAGYYFGDVVIDAAEACYEIVRAELSQ
jgi:hypothetical protein|tara:strand:+ start:2638 stop:2754 length:117 start_codon:yes stop_codon:yes gene_type:complete